MILGHAVIHLTNGDFFQIPLVPDSLERLKGAMAKPNEVLRVKRWVTSSNTNHDGVLLVPVSQIVAVRLLEEKGNGQLQVWGNNLLKDYGTELP